MTLTKFEMQLTSTLKYASHKHAVCCRNVNAAYDNILSAHCAVDLKHVLRIQVSCVKKANRGVVSSSLLDRTVYNDMVSWLQGQVALAVP